MHAKQAEARQDKEGIPFDLNPGQAAGMKELQAPAF